MKFSAMPIASVTKIQANRKMIIFFKRIKVQFLSRREELNGFVYEQGTNCYVTAWAKRWVKCRLKLTNTHNLRQIENVKLLEICANLELAQTA